MKDVLDLTLRQISEAVWKTTITFVILPVILWFVLREQAYTWYENMIGVIVIFTGLWFSFLIHFVLVLLLIKPRKITRYVRNDYGNHCPSRRPRKVTYSHERINQS